MDTRQHAEAIKEHLLDPWHLIMTAGIAFLAVGLSTGLLGFAPGITGTAIADEDGGSAVPSTLEVPLPREDDQGTYAVTVVEADGEHAKTIQDERTYLEFEWLEDRQVRDREGVSIWAHRLHDIFHEWSDKKQAYTPRTSVSLIDADTWKLQATSFVDENDPHPEGDDSRSGWEHRSTTLLDPDEIHTNSLCGMLNAFQGDPIDLDASRSVELFPAPCSLKQYWIESETFEPVGVHDVAGYEAVMFASEEWEGSVYLWMTSEIPYPLRVAVEHPDDPGLFDVLVLDTFDRGTGDPLRLHESVPPDPLDDLEMGSLERWGPIEDGVDHPFPLSEAWEVANKDQRVRTFVENHPDAYVFWADYQTSKYEEDTGETLNRTWFIRLGDTEETRTYAVIESTRSGPYEDPGGLDDPLQETTTHVKRVEATPPEALPPLTVLPDEVPTVASAMDWWTAYRGEEYEDREPNRWGLSIRCATAIESSSCEEATVEVFAGFSETESDEATTSLDPTYRWNDSRLSVDDQGYAVSVWESEQVIQTRPAASSPVRSSDSDDTDAAIASALSVPIWTFPAEHAGTIGLIGLLIALAYWAWPALRYLGVAPLYSRLQREDAIDHPTRQAILDLVEDQPGVHYAAIRRELDLGDGTVQHHLGKLEDLDLIRAYRTDGYTCYFRAGSVDPDLMEPAAVLRSDTARRLLSILSRGSGTTETHLADEAGISPSTAHHHVSRLERTGLVKDRQEGSARTLELTRLGEQALDQFVSS